MRKASTRDDGSEGPFDIKNNGGPFHDRFGSGRGCRRSEWRSWCERLVQLGVFAVGVALES